METAGQDESKPLRVLLVEDEFVVAMTLRVQLQALGCEVLGTAREANSGVEMTELLQPDLVLMDIGLREKSGVEATREIMRASPTKVIVVTAYGDERIQEALEAGAQAVLMKPVLEEQLAQAIAEVTGRRCGGAPQQGEEQ